MAEAVQAAPAEPAAQADPAAAPNEAAVAMNAAVQQQQQSSQEIARRTPDFIQENVTTFPRSAQVSAPVTQQNNVAVSAYNAGYQAAQAHYNAGYQAGMSALQGGAGVAQNNLAYTNQYAPRYMDTNTGFIPTADGMAYAPQGYMASNNMAAYNNTMGYMGNMGFGSPNYMSSMPTMRDVPAVGNMSMGSMGHGGMSMGGMDMSQMDGYGTPHMKMEGGHDFIPHMQMAGLSGLIPTGEQQFGGYSFNADGTLNFDAPISGMAPAGIQAFQEAIAELGADADPQAIQSKVAQNLTNYNDWNNLTNETKEGINSYYIENFGIDLTVISDEERNTIVEHLQHSPLKAGNVNMAGQQLAALPANFLNATSIHTIPEGDASTITPFIKVEMNQNGTANVSILSDNNNNNNSHHNHNLLTLANLDVAGMSEDQIKNAMVPLVQNVQDDNNQYTLSPGMRQYIANNVPDAAQYMA